MQKSSIELCRHIDTDIKVGDKVRFCDGSGFSIKDINDTHYIVIAYPDIFDCDQIVKEIVFEVKEVGVENRIVSNGLNEWAYLQDIVLEAPNGTIVYSCSKFVSKIKN